MLKYFNNTDINFHFIYIIIFWYPPQEFFFFFFLNEILASIDVYPYDLPRELLEIKKELEKIESYKTALKFKDEVIFKLLLDRKVIEEKVKNDADNEISEEVSEWAK